MKQFYFLDTEVNIGCLGSINDTTAFYKYQEMQSRLPSKSIAQSNQNFVVSDPAGNRIYGSHQQKILDYVEPEFVGDTSFMWDQASADSRSVAFSAIMSSTTGKFDSAETQLNVLRSRLPKSVPKISSYIASARSDRNLWNLYSGPAISVEGVNGMIRYDSIRGLADCIQKGFLWQHCWSTWLLVEGAIGPSHSGQTWKPDGVFRQPIFQKIHQTRRQSIKLGTDFSVYHNSHRCHKR